MAEVRTDVWRSPGPTLLQQGHPEHGAQSSVQTTLEDLDGGAPSEPPLLQAEQSRLSQLSLTREVLHDLDHLGGA